MEKITAICPCCGHQANAAANLIGKKTRCPECKTVFTIEPIKAGNDNTLENSEPGSNQVDAKREPNNSQAATIPQTPQTQIKCPHCGYQAKTKKDFTGRKIKCPQCKNIFIPGNEEQAETHCTPPISQATFSQKTELTNQKPVCNVNVKAARTKEGTTTEGTSNQENLFEQICGYFVKKDLIPKILKLYFYSFIVLLVIIFAVSSVFAVLHDNWASATFLVIIILAATIFFTRKKYMPFLKKHIPQFYEKITAFSQQQSGSQFTSNQQPATAEAPLAELIVRCPHCNASTATKPDWDGMEVRCPTCKQMFTIKFAGKPR